MGRSWKYGLAMGSADGFVVSKCLTWRILCHDVRYLVGQVQK